MTRSARPHWLDDVETTTCATRLAPPPRFEQRYALALPAPPPTVSTAKPRPSALGLPSHVEQRHGAMAPLDAPSKRVEHRHGALQDDSSRVASDERNGLPVGQSGVTLSPRHGVPLESICDRRYAVMVQPAAAPLDFEDQPTAPRSAASASPRSAANPTPDARPLEQPQSSSPSQGMASNPLTHCGSSDEVSGWSQHPNVHALTMPCSPDHEHLPTSAREPIDVDAARFIGAEIRLFDVDVLVVQVAPRVIGDRCEAPALVAAFAARFKRTIVLVAHDRRGLPTFFGPGPIAQVLSRIPGEALTWKRYRYRPPRPMMLPIPVDPLPQYSSDGYNEYASAIAGVSSNSVERRGVALTRNLGRRTQTLPPDSPVRTVPARPNTPPDRTPSARPNEPVRTSSRTASPGRVADPAREARADPPAHTNASVRASPLPPPPARTNSSPVRTVDGWARPKQRDS